MDIVGVQGEKPVRVAVDRTKQAIFDSLANHCPLLAGNTQHVFLDLGSDFFAESDVEILGRPICMALAYVSKFQMVYAQPARQCLSFGFQGTRYNGVARGNATIDGERHRHQRVAEEAALYVRQGKNAADSATSLSKQKIGRMAKDIANNMLPG